MKKFVSGAIFAAFAFSVAASAGAQTGGMESRTVQFNGSNVEVTWDPMAKIESTVTHSDKISLSNHDVGDVIEAATDCEANRGVVSFPDHADGYEAETMPIDCK